MSGVDEISFIDDVEGAASDLAGLAAWDSNGDGKIDASDERYDDFGVWRDADGDGAVDEGETASLEEVGISSIDLAGTAVNGTSEFGEVAIINTGSFTLRNGTKRTFADAALTYFSASTNLPEMEVAHYDFDRKAKKYRMMVAGGAMAVKPKKAKRASDQSAGLLTANTILDFADGSYGMFAPVAIDLDGDGIELMARKKARARFDYNGDGAADDTGWLGRDDGFLVIDRNNDGLITEASELSLAVERDGARSGLQGLAAIDSNGDGIVDSDDARFGELRVWQDANGNGRTDQGELKTLAELDIVSINIGNVRATRDWLKLDRNAVFATTTFVRGDGTTSTAADISLAYRPARPVADRVPAWHDGDFESWRNLWRSPHHSFWKRQKLQEHRADLATIGTVFDRLRWGHRDTLADLFDQFDKASFPALPVPATGATPSAEKHASLPGPIGAFLPENVDREAGQFSDHLEARLARRLALIRQDMGNFGFKTAGETGPEDFHTANPMDWYS